MGFGYGTKMDQYRLKPTAFPKGPSRAHLRYLTKEDRDAMVSCYQRVAARTHGMMDKTPREARRIFEHSDHRAVGYLQDGQVRGYLAFTFQQGEHFVVNDLHIQEWIYETPEALAELMTFLHTQADQIRTVIVETQDEFLHHLLVDPRDGSDRLIPSVYHETNAQGVGLMYRVVDIPAIFDLLTERNFGGQTCTVRLTVKDSFLPENAGSTLLRFEGGRVQRLDAGQPDVEVQLAIEHFSSLLAGTVAFRSLHNYGRAQISDITYVDTVNGLFAVEHKPVCMSHF
jgi:predicted acetyltransferase